MSLCQMDQTLSNNNGGHCWGPKLLASVWAPSRARLVKAWERQSTVSPAASPYDEPSINSSVSAESALLVQRPLDSIVTVRPKHFLNWHEIAAATLGCKIWRIQCRHVIVSPLNGSKVVAQQRLISETRFYRKPSLRIRFVYVKVTSRCETCM